MTPALLMSRCRRSCVAKKPEANLPHGLEITRVGAFANLQPGRGNGLPNGVGSALAPR